MQTVNGQRFYRSSNRILGGVCAGLAERFHLDPLWVRLAFLLLVFFQGAGLFVYIVLWLVMPEQVEGGGERGGFGAMTSDLRRIWGELQRQLGSKPQPAAAPADAAQPASASATPGPQKPAISQNQSLLLGVILVILGLGLLGSNIGIINWSVVWPAALITLGIVILVRNLERRP